ncbi:hypothetical protein ACFYNZ_10245 [Streptomyces kebangsaanensis]|uniref:Uncharacterized protein n=1 Tax=Streptomyces kebangsaanensis TaxID=864058 RepID=A0ABW6KTX0_9ACTN
MSLFGKKRSPELEDLMDLLAYSYLRGFAGDRSQILKDISAVATRLKSEGLDKAVARARSYRPNIFPALPVPVQREIAQYLDQALG